MKKLLASLFIFGALTVGIHQVNASVLSDALIQIENLKKEILQLKSSTLASTVAPLVISEISGLKTLKLNETGDWKISVYNPNKNTLHYSASWGDNTSKSTIDSQEIVTFKHSYSSAGTYTPTFTVTNSSGVSGTTSTSVVVSVAPPINKIATISSPTATSITYNSVTLSAKVDSLGVPATISERGICYRAYGTASRVDNGLSTCVNASGTGVGSFSVNISKGLTPSTSYSFIGFASHPMGPAMTSQGTFSTLAAPVNGPVISGIDGSQNLALNESGTWKITASDPKGGNLLYSVDWGYSVKNNSAPQQTATFTHSYSSAGTYIPIFTVTNSLGQTTKASVSIVVRVDSLVDNDSLYGYGSSYSSATPTNNNFPNVSGSYSSSYGSNNSSSNSNSSSGYSSSGGGCYSIGYGCTSLGNSNDASTSTDNVNTRILRTLRQGMSGEDVKILQKFLGLNADGVFGRATKAKVIIWQSNNGLKADGIVGPIARAKMGL